MPNKAPSFQFYVGDYLQDTRCLSLAAKGAWTDCLCAMWRSQSKGEITYPVIGFARLFGCTVEQAQAVIGELVEMQICDSVTHGDGKVTLINRRMKREAKDREQANNRQNKYRNKMKRGSDADGDAIGDEKVTSLSSSSTSFSSSDEKEKIRGRPGPPAAFSTKWQWSELTDEEKQMTAADFATHLQKLHSKKNVRDIAKKVADYCRKHKIAFALERVKGWVEGEHKTVSEEEFLEAFGAEEEAKSSRQIAIENCSKCDERGLVKTDGKFRECKHK